MWGGKRWNKAKENMSKEAEEDKLQEQWRTDRQTDRQTNWTNNSAVYSQYLTPAALLNKTITNHQQKRTEQQTLSYARP